MYKADDRTRTDNLLITNQLLCQLSHIGVYYIYLSDYSDKRTLFWESFSVTPTGIEPVLPPWKGDVLTAWPWGLKKTPRVGLEPTTTRLTAECSTIELSRNISLHLTKRKVDYMKYFQSSQDLFLIFQPQSTNGDGGIWTLAPRERPTPLAGAPLQPLEYISNA